MTSWRPGRICTWPSSKAMITFLVILLIFPSQLDALYCYRCLSLECEGNECEPVREFVVRQLRTYYHIETYLPPCPAINDTFAWRLREIEEDQCPGLGNSATCTAGRMQIRSSNRGGTKPTNVWHATILGCANIKLLNSIRTATVNSRCDMIKINGTSPDSSNQLAMELEHCSEPHTMCLDKDFCVSHLQSAVKDFKDRNRSLARFDYGLVLGIIAFIVVIFAAVIGASLFSFPLNRPSNLPKSDADADLVGVRISNEQPDESDG